MTVLYKPTKTGATQQWSVVVQGDSFICTYGQLNGKMTSQSTTCTGKNIGRANETTPEQQAQLEANALVTKKLKSGYSYEISDTPSVKLPMKVKSYQDQLKNIKFPCISTPKLNGVNGIYKRVNGELTIYSRGGEIYPPIPHLEKHIHDIMDELPSDELNVELYVHGEHLQDIQSAVKKPNKLSPRLTANIFDICDVDEDYESRRIMLETLYSTLKRLGHPSLQWIGLLIGVKCNSHEDIETHYNHCMAGSLEGTVIKNLDGMYKHNVRSSDQFKYKKVQSKEFLIISFELDKNGLPVFIMNVKDKFFKAKPKGTKEYWSSVDPHSFVNKCATIEFEMYSKDGIPLKPIFISTREMDSNGNPKE
jgi:DNA ligase-1